MAFWTTREAKRHTRPSIESLEGRTVPTTFQVADVAHLLAAVASINNSPTTSNTIVMKGGQYILPSTLKIQNASDLTIKARPANKAAVDIVGGIGIRPFEIDGGNVTLSGISIQGGRSVDIGGGILAQGANLTLKSTVVENNQSVQAGGGIFANGGTLDLQNSSVDRNTVGGGIDSFGGGLATLNAKVTIKGGSVNANTAFVFKQDPQTAISHATGGGIYIQGGTLDVTAASLSSNDAFTTTTGPNAISSGAAVASANAAVKVTGSTITSNTLIATGKNNSETHGSAFSIYGGTLTVSQSKFNNNSPAGLNNQIDQTNATVVVTNVTVGNKQLAGPTTL